MKYFWIYFAAGSALIIWFSWAVSIRARFGEEYTAYTRRTKRFIPFLV